MQDPDAMMGITTPASAWKKRPQVIALPSGNRMRVKRASLQTFLAQGIIPNSLMAIVQQSIKQGNSASAEDELKAILDDSTKLAELMDLMNAVTVFCAVEPRVLPTPADEADRSDDELYVDELDEADKTAIFNAAIGGTAELEPFRK